MTLFLTSRLCLTGVAVVVLCGGLLTVKCDDTIDRQNDDDDDDFDSPNASDVGESSTPKGDGRMGNATRDEEGRPNNNDTMSSSTTDNPFSELGPNGDGGTLRPRRFNDTSPLNVVNDTDGVTPQIPSEHPIAGDTATAPPPLTSMATTNSQKEAVDSFLDSIFGPSSSNSTVTTPSSTFPDNETTNNSVTDNLTNIENVTSHFNVGSNTSVNASEVTSHSPILTNGVNETNNLTSTTEPELDYLNETSGEIALSNDTVTDNSTSVDNSTSSFLGHIAGEDNSTGIPDNSTTPNGILHENSNLTNDTTTEYPFLNASSPVDNSTLSNVDNSTSPLDNTSLTTQNPEENVTLSTATDVDNAILSEFTPIDNTSSTTQNPEENATLTTPNMLADNATLQNGTAEDNSTLPNATDVGNVTLAGSIPTDNTSLTTMKPEDNSTLTTTFTSIDNSTLQNGTNEDNSTLANTTNVDNVTLPSEVPKNNSTNEDTTTLANVTSTINSTLPFGPELTTSANEETETITPTSETTIISPEIPPETAPLPKENLPGDCSDSLGLENGAGRFTASDWSPGFLPEEARLNGRSGWVGGFVDVHYIQVELPEAQGISGIRLQPHAQWHRNVIQDFRFLYSLDGYQWSKYSYTQNNHTYEVIRTALDEHVSESLHVFNPPLQARFVAINPVRWVGTPGPALRFELYGCRSTVSASAIVAPRIYRGEMQREITWEAGAPYLVDQMIRIWPGVTFRLHPGVQVYFTNPLAGFYVEGRIVAEGKENSSVSFESGHVLSQLTIGPFWRGLDFVNGDTHPSSLSQVKISGAAIGVQAIANSVTLKNVDISRCETGFRLESGTQIKPNIIENGIFNHNKYGIHIQNVTGNLQISNVQFRDQKVIGINGYFVYEPNVAANSTTLSLSHVTVENSSYAIYLTGYNNLNLDVTNTKIYDCHYGLYLDYSDAVPSISTNVKDSTFIKNRVYGLVVDYKHFARSSWYRGPHNFKTTVTNCVFDTGANGISYYSPEVTTGTESECLLQTNKFKNLHSGVIVQQYELSSFQILNNLFLENGGRALDIYYHAIGVKGLVKSNTFEHNHAADNANDTDIQNDTLVVLDGNSDAEMHGMLTFTENLIMNNSFPHILETSLVSVDMRFNVFENKMADCELCVTSLWVHGGKTLNASHNWWGTPKLNEATQRVSDFYRDMDVAATEISPILREPRVLGASWDTVRHRIIDGGSISDGGDVTGNVTAEANKVLDIMATIYIPEGSRLNILAGSHLRFAKDIGIVVEGQLYILGSQEKPVILEPQKNAKWKGIRLSYAKVTSLNHLFMSQSRGIESSGSIPKLDSATLSQSTGPGLWITVIQPPPIEINGVVFENGAKEGMLLEIQGDGTSEVSLSITDCQVTGNKGSGIVIRAGNVIANISLEQSVIANNSQDGVSIEMSNGRLKMANNTFRNRYAGSSLQNNRLAHIEFDGRCIPDAVRDVEITGNTFSEENTTSTPGSLLLETPCINETSLWNVADNSFSIVGPTVPGDEAMLKFNMADNTQSTWPLALEIVNNSFTCHTQVGSSVRLSVAHGERVSFQDNQITSCDAPLLVENRYSQHELTIIHNTFERTGPVVLQSIETVINETYSAVNFSYNEVARSSGEHEAVLKTTGYNASIHYNFFENPESRHDLWVGDMAPVNATFNWWGTPDFNRIIARVFDGRTDYSRAQADIFPCLLSRNYSNISSANPDVFQITDNVIGGSVHGNITLPHSTNPYDVKYPIRVPAGSSLTIPGGTTLYFHNHTGIFADGQLILDGNSTAWIEMRPANDTTSWRGVTVGKPRQEFMRVRLSGSHLTNTGRVETYVSGVWRGVCADGFNMAAAHVVCKELSFFDAEKITDMASSLSSFGVSDVKCTGLEISLLDCNVRTGLQAKCESGRTPVVVCQQESNEPAESVRSRKRRSTSVVSDNHPTVLKFTRIFSADVGLQVNDDDGIELDSMNVVSSTGPGVVLSSRGSMGVHLTDCIVANGGDVGIDVAGSCSVTMTSTNVTWNKMAGVNVIVKGEESDVQIVDSIISENGEDGIHTITDRGFNISGCQLQLNQKMGIVVDAATASIAHTIVEDHALGGVLLHVNDGQFAVKNSVLANNGGNSVNATVTVRSNSSTKPLVEFERSGIVNSSVYESNTSRSSYAVILHLDSEGATVSSNTTIPVRFLETHFLDSFGQGLWIEDLHDQLNLTLIQCVFEHVQGTAIHVVTNNTAPELYFQGNVFHHVLNNTLLVDTEVR